MLRHSLRIAKPNPIGYHLWRGKNQMLIFGHTGITLGAAVLLKSILARSYSLQPRVNKVTKCLQSTSKTHPAQRDPSSGRI
ncbi:MAG: hypothetical protein ACUZ77_05920 [Candidatus Brocadiales bacterium]